MAVIKVYDFYQRREDDDRVMGPYMATREAIEAGAAEIIEGSAVEVEDSLAVEGLVLRDLAQNYSGFR